LRHYHFVLLNYWIMKWYKFLCVKKKTFTSCSYKWFHLYLLWKLVWTLATSAIQPCIIQIHSNFNTITKNKLYFFGMNHLVPRGRCPIIKNSGTM
jgi:hypothetical protein